MVHYRVQHKPVETILMFLPVEYKCMTIVDGVIGVDGFYPPGEHERAHPIS